MNQGQISILLNQETFILDKFKAIYHPSSQSLIIADVHLGKTTHFRKHGIAIPTDVAHSDLKRLFVLIESYNPLQVIIAGDFFHASANSEISLFKEWRKSCHKINFVLIKGNHDRLKGSVYKEMEIELIKDSLEFDNFSITHHPQPLGAKLNICGHIHPGVSLQLNARQKVRLPCFLSQSNQLILPAFSEFTGLDTSLQATGRNFAITDSGVLEV